MKCMSTIASFGLDAATFRPERWLEADKEMSAEMNRYWMPFGLGSRTCIGKNIRLLEMNKALPVLIDMYDFELADALADGAREMHWVNQWFVRPVELPVRMKKTGDSINPMSVPGLPLAAVKSENILASELRTPHARSQRVSLPASMLRDRVKLHTARNQGRHRKRQCDIRTRACLDATGRRRTPHRSEPWSTQKAPMRRPERSHRCHRLPPTNASRGSALCV